MTYPLFRFVAAEQSLAYHLFYNRRITTVVIVPELLSFLSSFGLIALRPPSVPLWAGILSAVLGGLALVVTVVLESPRHIGLQRGGKSDLLIEELIVYNWLEIFAITAQAVLMV